MPTQITIRFFAPQGEYAAIVKVVQLCWAVICLCQVLFMFSRAPRVPWEAIYLPGVECIIYTMSFSGNGYVRMVDGRILLWSRMASWLVCCPVSSPCRADHSQIDMPRVRCKSERGRAWAHQLGEPG